MRRRRFLACAGTVTTGVIAGCLNSSGEIDESETQLGWFAVHNYDTEPQTFELRVVRDEEQVHSSTADVSGATEATIPGHVAECTWGDSDGKYTVAARLEEGEWAEQRLSENPSQDADCVVASADYARFESGDFSFLTSENSTLDCTDVTGFEGGCAFANEM